jgi:predicted DNA-binding helix-hairpin-helix protein
VREHRLYEASFLLRDYGFRMEELPFNPNGLLPLDVDPKYAWASTNFRDHPVEINQAEKQTLLRIPGIGPKIANSIVEYRLKHRLFQPEELSQFGVNLKRAAPFILVNGKYLAYQTSFL